MSCRIIHKISEEERSFLFRVSTEEDLKRIHEWLEEEYRQGVRENFLCNWSIIESAQQEGQLIVLMDESLNHPVAYQLGGLLETGILQVREPYRKKGLGRRFVEYCVKCALAEDEMVLQVECKPWSSQPFWKSMGFTIIERQQMRNPLGYRVLTKRLDLPNQGKSVEIQINGFYSGSTRNGGENSLCCKNVPGKTCEQGLIHLSERVSIPHLSQLGKGDLAIEIIVGEKTVYCDKAKYENAVNLGVKRSRNGFYIDIIQI
jgi:GNAT superfamily N-acetyltransferase